ncbi:MAG: AAA family ATPase [Nitrospinales bacterium]
MNSAKQSLDALRANVESVIIGKPETIQLAIITLLARGHLLIEDVPGVGKTSLAYALAHSMNLSFKRIQFTNDILPADITGVSIYNQKENRFRFSKGPIFSNLVLADEINRSSPRTQSALLEAMNESQVTVDNATYDLERPFMVIATQNPIESHGAFPLPESQMDRFMMYISMGYPSIEDERHLLTTQPTRKTAKELKPILDKPDVIDLQHQVDRVKIEPVLTDYTLSLVKATRASKYLSLGISPRGGLILQQAARARALLHGRQYCIPDDIKQLAVSVFSHRVIPAARHGKRSAADTAPIIMDIVDSQEVPV